MYMKISHTGDGASSMNHAALVGRKTLDLCQANASILLKKL
jgi:hypothetical protein